MGKEIHYRLQPNKPMSPEEIAMLEAASGLTDEYDEDNPEIDPVTTPELYAALMNAVAERNTRLARHFESA